MRYLAVLFCFLATALFPLMAQNNPTTGAINGTVTDNTGAALPGVTVTATNVETGLTRNTETEGDGTYRIALLPPGRYRVNAELSGLGTAQRDNVTVLLGTTSKVDIQIAPQLAEEITVTAEAPVVDTSQSGLATAVTENQIENLPILGRDFRDLALLTPGVATTFGERVAFNGARGIQTDYNIDGADTNSDFFGEQRGGTRAPFTFSQAAIREFQVVRSSFSAEFAKGVGGTLNAVTKSGTNELKGQAFFYHRGEDWAADRPDVLDGLPVADTFLAKDVSQYGLALGGPIVRDRFHYFVNADFQDQAVPVIAEDFRTRSEFTALPAETRTAFITRLENLLGHSLDEEFRYDRTEDQEVYLVKFDANLGTRHHISLRDNFSEFTNFASESFGLLSYQGVFENSFNSAVLQAESVLTPSIFNQAIVQVSNEERPRTPINTSIPETDVVIGSTFSFGQRDFLPNNLIEDKIQIKDNVSFIWRNHTFKTGLEYVQNDLDNSFPRDFAGEYQYASVADFLANKPRNFEQGLGPEGIEGGNNVFDYYNWGAFIQDTMNLFDNRLTLDLGVRYDFQSLPKPIRNIVPAYPEFLENFENEDDNNIAGRLGFAYDIFGNGRSVFRGGVGQYYNYLPSILLAAPLAQIGGLFSNIRLTCSTQACPTYPNLLSRSEFEAFTTSARDITIIDDNLEATESLRAVLGYEHQLGTSYSVGIEGTWSQFDKAQRLVNVNAVPTGVTYGNLTLYSVNNPNRRYPTLQNVLMHVSDAEGEFKSISLSTKKLALGDSRLSWLAHYTWSEAIDQDSNERSTSTPFSIDPFNPELNEGRADYDVTHKVVLSGSYELPLGFLVSGIFNWRTGIPYTPAISGFGNGLSGLGVFTPLFVDRDGEIIDLTQASGLSQAELSAFLAERGARLQERNAEDQPDFMNLDIRLAKRFNLIHDFQVEIIGELFNALNETNQFIPGPNRNMFNARFSNNVWTFTRPENFAKANAFNDRSEPRQVQVALKLHF